MVAAIEQRYPQREIERRAYEYQQKVESKQRIVVGVNDFVMKEPPVRGLHHLDPQAEADRVSEIRALRAARDEQQTQESLRALSEKASQPAASDRNLTAAIVDAVKAQATVGEIADTLRTVFGEYLG
jgi:methylmalonyl-CoA mutase N-terminal domain/subunit